MKNFKWFLPAVAVLFFGSAAAQGYPDGPVRVVVAFPPGGSTDITARLIAPKLSAKWRQPVIVENKPGAAANIGTDYVAKSEPDGSTLLLATTAIAISAVVYEKLTYDALNDLAPVTMVSTIPNVLVVHPSVPAATVHEFIAHAKARPGKLNFAAPGAASGQRMTFELIKQLTGTDIVMVPYKGGAPAVQATLAGEVQAMIVNVVEAAQFVQAGKLRALATTTRPRSPLQRFETAWSRWEWLSRPGRPPPSASSCAPKLRSGAASPRSPTSKLSKEPQP